MKRDLIKEVATSLKAGYTYSLSEILPDPDPILRKIGADVQTYTEIRSDAKVAACVESRKAGCLAMQWDLTGDNETEQATAAIKDALLRLDMPRLISEILDAFLWGFQPLEIMWEEQQGLILPRSVVGKPPHWFVFDAANNLRFRSLGSASGELLPERKFLLAQHHPTYTNPYGDKILPRCFWPVTFKRGGLRWWVTSTEKFGMPFVIGKVPRGTDTAEQEQLLETLDQLVQDAIAILPNDSQIEILDGNQGKTSSSTSPHKDLIDHCNTEIALAIVGQTLSSEVGSTGSYAASKTHNEVREEIVAGDKRMVERALQQLVAWTYELNWGQGRPPQFGLYLPDDVDKVLAERDKILTETGIKFTHDYYVKAYGLDEADFEVLRPDGPSFAAPQQGLSTGTYLPKDASIHSMAQKLLEPVRQLLISSKSFDEVEARIFDLYPTLNTDKLQEALHLALYMANIGGSISARRD